MSGQTNGRYVGRKLLTIVITMLVIMTLSAAWRSTSASARSPATMSSVVSRLKRAYAVCTESTKRSSADGSRATTRLGINDCSISSNSIVVKTFRNRKAARTAALKAPVEDVWVLGATVAYPNMTAIGKFDSLMKKLGAYNVVGSPPSKIVPRRTITTAPAPTTTVDPLASLRTWWTGVGTPLITQLANDLTAEAAPGLALSTLQADCTQLQRDVAGAQSAAPIPAPDLQAAWSTALSTISQGATLCIAGIDDGSYSEAAQSSAAIIQGGQEMAAAIDPLKARLGLF